MFFPQKTILRTIILKRVNSRVNYLYRVRSGVRSIILDSPNGSFSDLTRVKDYRPDPQSYRIVRQRVGRSGIIPIAKVDKNAETTLLIFPFCASHVDRPRVEIGCLQLAFPPRLAQLQDVPAIGPQPTAGQLRWIRSCRRSCLVQASIPNIGRHSQNNNPGNPPDDTTGSGCLTLFSLLSFFSHFAFSNGKILFQSFFMSTTIQALALASSRALSKRPTCDVRS